LSHFWGSLQKVSNAVDKGTVTIGYSALAFIDLVSQKDILRKINKLPENDDEEREFISLWKQSVGVIQNFRVAFDSFYESFLNHSPLTPPKGVNVSADQIELVRRFLKCEIRKQCFSDSMIYYASMMETPERFPITGIHALLSGCAGVFLSALSFGYICRGGIEAGIAGEFFKGEVYGPALYHAYRLESEVAQYPRIVVGPSLVEYIDNETRRPPEDEASSLIRDMAQRCKNWLCVDLDGITILDYAGAAAQEVFPVLEGALEKAIKFATDEWKRFRMERNSKLAGRYFLLLNYLKDRSRRVRKNPQ
jgi:hypothetical protein